MHRENASDNPTKHELVSLFDYREGVLYAAKSRGSLKTGSPVGSTNSNGYLVTSVNRRPMKVHRIIYLMHHGYLPAMIDHINGDKQDNRIENLRPATAKQNQQNHGKRKTNTSGARNVMWHKPTQKWRVIFWADGKQRQFGVFTEFTDAVQKAAEVREELHGQYARA